MRMGMRMRMRLVMTIRLFMSTRRCLWRWRRRRRPLVAGQPPTHLLRWRHRHWSWPLSRLLWQQSPPHRHHHHQLRRRWRHWTAAQLVQLPRQTARQMHRRRRRCYYCYRNRFRVRRQHHSLLHRLLLLLHQIQIQILPCQLPQLLLLEPATAADRILPPKRRCPLTRRWWNRWPQQRRPRRPMFGWRQFRQRSADAWATTVALSWAVSRALWGRKGNINYRANGGGR